MPCPSPDRSSLAAGAALLPLVLILHGCAVRPGDLRTSVGPPEVAVDVPTSRYVDVPDLVRKLSEISGGTVQIGALPGARGVRLTGPADRVARLHRLLARPPCDPPAAPGAARVAVIPLRHLDAVSTLGRLSGQLSPGIRLQADVPTNSLVLVAPPDVARRLRERVLAEDRAAGERPRPRR